MYCVMGTGYYLCFHLAISRNQNWFLSFFLFLCTFTCFFRRTLTFFYFLLSTLTTLHFRLSTSVGGPGSTRLGGQQLTLRKVLNLGPVDRRDDLFMQVISTDDWYCYECTTLVSKQRYNATTRTFDSSELERDAIGVAMTNRWFARGSERIAFQCTEYKWSDELNGRVPVGRRLAAKESVHVEKMYSPVFHKNMAGNGRFRAVS